MTLSRMTVRAKLAIAATAVAAAALPLQAGVAHASTPSDDLTACVRGAVATLDDNFSAEVDACVDTYLQELGLEGSDGSTVSVSVTPAVDTTAVTAGEDVNTGILGTVTDDSSAGNAG